MDPRAGACGMTLVAESYDFVYEALGQRTTFGCDQAYAVLYPAAILNTVALLTLHSRAI